MIDPYTYGYLKTGASCQTLDAKDRMMQRIGVGIRMSRTEFWGTVLLCIFGYVAAVLIVAAFASNWPFARSFYQLAVSSPAGAKTIAASPPSTGYDAGGYTIVATPPTGP